MANSVDGTQVTEFFGLGDLTLAGQHIVKSYPEIKGLKKGSDAPSSITPLFEFTVAANSAGAVEWKKMTFAIAASGVNVSNLYLREKGYAAKVNDAPAQINSRGEVEIFAGTATNHVVEQIRAGGSKTYQLFAESVTGWSSGDSLTASISKDWQNLSKFTGIELGKIGKFVWSDRSTARHTINTNDWFVSSLVPHEPLTSGAATYTYSSGSALNTPPQENPRCNSWWPWSTCAIR